MLTLLGIIYAITCVLLVVIVLLQSGKAGSMGLFGGGGTSSIGSQGGDIMTRITTVLGVLFFVLALVFAFIVARDNTVSRHERALIERGNILLAPGEQLETPPADSDSVGQQETGTP